MIHIAAYALNEDGWGRHSRELARALARHEPTELVDFSCLHPSRLSFWRRMSPSWKRSVGVCLGHVQRTLSMNDRYRVAYYIGETTRVPLDQLFFLKRADMVWTPSHWGRSVLDANGVHPARIRIVPEGVDSETFRPPSQPRSQEGRFRFLCVAKWEERKGTASLVRAFRDEFRPQEPVELVMHCGAAKATAETVRAALDGADLRIVCTDPVDLPGLVFLMQNCHAFVLPTRAEGWGLPILEAMACELPCIVTGYSGLTEFANERNCFPVRVAEMRPVRDPVFYDERHDWGEWAELDPAHLRSLMRFVYENRLAATIKAKRAREEAARLWSWERAAETAMTHLRELRDGRSR
jgi:glycosyltransferase involved in cell wall biosynthesis